MKILYVEDEAEAREALSKYLKRRFGKIFVAGDGIEGMRIFREEAPDLVIADLYMPNMDGLEMIREIKKTAPDTYVVITSAVDDVGVILKSVDIGIDKYLLKPIKPDQLTEAIGEYREILARRQKSEKTLEGDEKKQTEDKIKKEFTSFLKTTTGKGPSGIAVFINSNLIEVTVFDALTTMELNMVDNSQNSIIIEEYRKLFYSINEKALCDLIQEILGSRVKMQHVEVSGEKKTNKIEFKILD